MRSLWIALVVSLALAVSAGAEDQLDLSQCFTQALKRSEALQIRAEDIAVAEARYRELYGAIYPTVHLGANQRLKNSASRSGNDSNFGTGSGSSHKNQFSSFINVQQPIFTGFREFLLADAQQAELQALEHDRKRNTELLYADVANLYFQILLNEGDLKELAKTDGVLRARLHELDDWLKLGKAKESEIIAAQVERRDLAVTQEQVRGLLQAGREMLGYLIGQSAGSFSLTVPKTPPAASPLDSYLDQKNTRADIQAARARERSAHEQLRSAEREGWPVVTAQANVYGYEDPNNERDWDVLIGVDLPLFEGGRIRARQEQSRAAERASTLKVSQIERASDQEVRVAYVNFSSSQREVAQLKDLVKAAQKNYDAQQADYKLGVVTNLDVLQAIRQVQDTRRRLLSAQMTAHANLARLKVAAGDVPL